MTDRPPPDYTNRGKLKPNAKRPGKRDPDYRGVLNVQGATFWCSCWVNEDDTLSLAVNPQEEGRQGAPQANGHRRPQAQAERPQERPRAAQGPQGAGTPEDEFQDDIPF